MTVPTCTPIAKTLPGAWNSRNRKFLFIIHAISHELFAPRDE